MRTCPWLFMLVLCGCSQAAVITELKPLYPATEIAIEGRARAAIVCPESEELRGIASALSARIAELSGARLELLTDTSVVSEDWQIDHQALAGRNLVALGNCNTNRLLAVLWGDGYVRADSIYPGLGGYVIRTVHDPFANGVNVLVLAGSDVAGTERAVDEFCGRYVQEGDLVLGEPVVDVAMTVTRLPFLPEPMPGKRQPQMQDTAYWKTTLLERGLADADGNILSLQEGTLSTVTGAISELAAAFWLTGNRDLPPMMKSILDKNRHLLDIVQQRASMQGGSSGHIERWDLVEELPIWTDEDRLLITNAFYTDAQAGHEERLAHRLVREGYVQVLDTNHGTHSALQSFGDWHYFDKYYDLPETDYWMDVVTAIFDGQCSTYQILEDASTYLTSCPGHTMSYAFGSGDLKYLQREIAREHAYYIAQCSLNNLGFNTGFGDASGLSMVGAYSVIAEAAWYYKDPYLAWLSRNLVGRWSLRAWESSVPFDLTVDPEVPTHLTGMTRIPIYLETLAGMDGSERYIADPKESVGPQWFNKIVFRDGWSPGDQYLLLDGAGKWRGEQEPRGPSGHKHNDINTIINFTDRGRMWLVDHTYGTRGIKDHSGLYITRDGSANHPEYEARLIDFAENGPQALCRTVLENFSGADWERSIFWQRGDWFVVIDRAIAEEPGLYVIRCSWRGLGEPEMAGRSLRLSQAGEHCEIQGDGGSRLDLEDFKLPNSDEWNAFYDYSDGTARVFQQDKSAQLEAGQQLTFANLIHTAGSREGLDTVQMTAISPTAVMVDAGGDRALCGAGALPALEAELGSWMLADSRALLAGVTRLGPETAPMLISDAPVNVALEAHRPVRLEVRQAAAVTVGDGEAMALDAGWHVLSELTSDTLLERLTGRTFPEAERMGASYTPAGAGMGREPFGLATTSQQLPVAAATVAAADIDGDGREDLIAVGAEGAVAVAAGGETLWRFETDEPCRALDVGDLDGDGSPEVAVGCDDHNLYMLDADGSLLWQFEAKPTRGATIPGPPAIDLVDIVDLEGDGAMEVVVGANWTHCLDAGGDILWEHYLRLSRGRICGDFTCGEVVDVTGDGNKEIVVYYIDSYHMAVVYDHQGNGIIPRDWSHVEGRGHYGVSIVQPQAMAVAQVAEGRPPVMVEGGDSHIFMKWCDGEFPGETAFYRPGSYSALATFTPADEVLAWVYGGTDMGVISGLHEGTRRDDVNIHLSGWTQVIGRKVSSLWAGDVDGDGRGEVIAGTADGGLYRLDAATGEVLGMTEATGSAVVDFVMTSRGVAAVHADGMMQFPRAE